MYTSNQLTQARNSNRKELIAQCKLVQNICITMAPSSGEDDILFSQFDCNITKISVRYQSTISFIRRHVISYK